MSDPAIRIENVSKSFDDVHAVKGISLEIREGEFFSLLGPSGCGKTTLLRMIAGFEYPTSGRIVIGGKDMAGVAPHKRPVNMVFQSYALFPHMSVFENIAFGLRTQKSCPVDEIPKRVEEALALVRLPQLAHRYPRELSGGQQQRVAFARAIVNKPLVLLLDEPLSALDPRIREEMQTELARFKRELGITFVMVTHDQSEAFALSDKIAVFNAGQLEQMDTAHNIYEHPKSAFVADFIGHTNVLTAEVVSVNGAFATVSIAGQGKLIGLIPPDTVISADDVVTVWIRTDAISIIKTADSSLSSGEMNVLSGRIEHLSYQGNTSEVIVRAGELALTASIPSASALTFHSQDDVSLLIAPQRTHILQL